MTLMAGLVLRCKDRGKTAAFYKALGLKTHEHAHGGPLHIEMGPLSPTAAFEAYDASPKYSRDALMVEVDSIEQATGELTKGFITGPLNPIIKHPKLWLRYVTDPDDRPVMLMENRE